MARALFAGLVGPELDVDLQIAAALLVTPANNAVNIHFAVGVNAHVAVFVDVSFFGIFGLKIHIADWSFALLSLDVSSSRSAPFGTAPVGNGLLPGFSGAELEQFGPQFAQLPASVLSLIVTSDWLNRMTYLQLFWLSKNPYLNGPEFNLVWQYRFKRLADMPTWQLSVVVTPTMLGELASETGSGELGILLHNPNLTQAQIALVQQYYEQAVKKEQAAARQAAHQNNNYSGHGPPR